MADQAVDKKVLGDKALELVMRDVLCGMEDLAMRFGFDVTPYRVEILSIEPDRSASVSGIKQDQGGVVVAFPQRNAVERAGTRRKKIS